MNRNSITILLFLFCLDASANTFCTDTIKERRKDKKNTIVINNEPANLSKDCDQINAAQVIIEEAIDVGAPTYNEGNHIGCYRIYEGAAYKILYKYGNKCKQVRSILETAIEKSYGDHTATEKAWIMRIAFDTILGVATTTTR